MAVVGVGLYSFAQVEQSNALLADGQYVLTQQQSADQDHDALRSDLLAASEATGPERRSFFRGVTRDADTLRHSLDGLASRLTPLKKPALVRLVSSTEAALDSYAASGQRIAAVSEDPSALARARPAFDAHFIEARNEMAVLTTALREEVAHADRNAVRAVRQGRQRTEGVAGLAVMVLLALTARVWRSVSKSLHDKRETARKLAVHADQLTALSLHDALTGLGNRVMLQDRLEHALSRRVGSVTTVLMIDLDDFKSVNDEAGHAGGDQLLVEIAARLRAAVRPSDTVARLGGDEFAIVLEDAQDVDGLARRLLLGLAAPLVVEGRQILPGASLGIASARPGSITGDELLRRADLALYAVKTEGKGHVAHYHNDMNDRMIKRRELESGLRQAVEAGEIVVHYQALVAPDRNGVCGVEALVRWHRPTGVVCPNDFIPIAEETGLIVAIGWEVLVRSLTELRAWLADDSTLSMSVNVSARQLLIPTFATDVLAELSRQAIDPHQLVLELTESLFADFSENAVKSLNELRRSGVRVAIDDFGTGYSSLGRLQALPVDAVKIDRVFVAEIHHGDEDLPILAASIALAHGLGLHVTAEGVETEAQVQRLVALGCETLQGYHFARPCPPGQLPAAITTAEAVLRGFGLSADAAAQSIHILVVEDDPVVRTLTRLYLNKAAAVVHEAAGWAEGLALAQQVYPDCVLVDVGLPDGDGIDLVRELRADPIFSRTAIIVLTAAADQETKQRAFDAGADDYLAKPVTGALLLPRIKGAMRAITSNASRGARVSG